MQSCRKPYPSWLHDGLLQGGLAGLGGGVLIAGSVAAAISCSDLGTGNVAGDAGPLLATTQSCSNSAAAAAANATAITAAGVQGLWGGVWASLQALASRQCYVLAVDGTQLFPSSRAHASTSVRAASTPEVRTRAWQGLGCRVRVSVVSDERAATAPEAKMKPRPWQAAAPLSVASVQ